MISTKSKPPKPKTNSMSHSVFCLANSQTQVSRIATLLQNADFVPSAISVLFPDTSSTGEFGKERSTKASEGMATGLATGGVAGGALGLLAGIGALAIPGVGPLIAAGPIVAALSGAAVGATAAGLVGGLIGLGIPESHATRYEDRLRKGSYLVSVHARNNEEVVRAQVVFAEAGGEEISTAVIDSRSQGCSAEGLVDQG
jgi:hypothetical protein